jgi:hypothetical protein
MGATCGMCKQDMTVADGCHDTYFLKGETAYDRIRVGQSPDWTEGDRCHDCNAKQGEFRHRTLPHLRWSTAWL